MHFSMAAYLAALCASALEASNATDTPTNRAVERILEALICSSYGTLLGKTRTSLMGKANRVRCCRMRMNAFCSTRSHPNWRSGEDYQQSWSRSIWSMGQDRTTACAVADADNPCLV